ncbi:MAG: sigma-70 family RNA polymerase sigma factor [Clostridia bacterium]|nr:sigma-70 family RNA polymerase sigma factor [Clostridia bacterium]MBR2969238.1 sigma-70 family RNA polymerase sigma factor [Clostridia bacterium]
MTAEKTTSLEDLALAYQSGDTGALDEIIERCSHVVKNVSRRYFLIGADTDDLYQEGFLGLIKAAKSFAPGKSTFIHFAFICVNTAVVSAVRKYAGDKNRILNDGLPLSEVDNALSVAENPEELFIENEDRLELVSSMNEKLSSFEREILSLYLSGMSYAEMQSRTGKPFKSIDNALQRIRKKIKNK